ncbi:MAG: PA3496 family putative envelope integrity protein [Methylobacter sp.]
MIKNYDIGFYRGRSIICFQNCGGQLKSNFYKVGLTMTKKSSKSVIDKSAPKPEDDKNKDEIELDIEEFDLSVNDEYITLPNENERAAKKMAARRKIEMYWEKKRLQEQLGDFDELDLDFDF